MSVDLRLMRYVLAVADHGGFVAAAAALHMAQPPLSQQIAELERELGVTLFHRRPTRLTAAGEVFAAGARQTLAMAERTVADTRLATVGLRIGYTMSTAATEAPLLVDAMRQHLPQLRIDAEQYSDAGIDRDLRTGRLHLAIGRCLPDRAEFARQVLRRDPWVAVVCGRHRLAGRTSIVLDELAGDELLVIARQVSPAYRDAMVTMVGGRAVRVRRTRTACLRDLDLRDLPTAFTLVPGSVTDRLPTGLVGLALRDELPPVELEVLWRKDNPHSAARDLVRRARRIAVTNGWVNG